MGFWWASVPKTRWPDDPEWREHIDKMWDQVYGDRRQEIVFIGAELDEAVLRQRLDDCLVSEMAEQDMPVKDWSQLPDPFPAWKRAESNA